MFVKLEKQGNIGILTLNRPEALNTISPEVTRDLDAAISALETDETIYAVILTGAGRAFAAGGDLSSMKDWTVLEAREFSFEANRVFSRLESLPQPVIAAVNGVALGGGCELAMSCDIRIASDKAKLGQPEVNFGITPAAGGTQRLQRIVGMPKAMELIWTGTVLDAGEALAIGLVNRVVPHEELMEAALGLARTIASKPQVPVRLDKTVIRRGAQCDLQSGIELEISALALCYSSEDQKNAMGAFLEKRKPEPFKNK
ncbi:enoyl-CoA hydratase-related protein [Papillibacter cinnamivorans]|uniref:short-chain-enoyl-CoA hydratase n=1 Tax=Papillibacter cinnamivorans DSM 12816 TaxID=1122930 RepID=A0A1W1ZKP0_9FIRM|nr:enoyl-CoA hydratase-related protein [Papillibacter cinnamivorans]SMC49019.1 enoyl-CoA hydratase [Papillibacter cinnamivorans DSM 12816]